MIRSKPGTWQLLEGFLTAMTATHLDRIPTIASEINLQTNPALRLSQRVGFILAEFRTAHPPVVNRNVLADGFKMCNDPRFGRVSTASY